MKPNQTVPLIATFAPALAAAPPLLIGAAIGVGLLWLLSDKDEPTPPTVQDDPDVPPLVIRPMKAAGRRVMREDVAEALEYGARALTRLEAVAALQALGFGKTAAYKGLSPDGRFGDFLEHTPDGLIEWKG